MKFPKIKRIKFQKKSDRIRLIINRFMYIVKRQEKSYTQDIGIIYGFFVPYPQKSTYFLDFVDIFVDK